MRPTSPPLQRFNPLTLQPFNGGASRYLAASSSARKADRLTSVGMKPVSLYVTVTLPPPSFENDSVPAIFSIDAWFSFQLASRNCARNDSMAALAFPLPRVNLIEAFVCFTSFASGGSVTENFGTLFLS